MSMSSSSLPPQVYNTSSPHPTLPSAIRFVLDGPGSYNPSAFAIIDRSNRDLVLSPDNPHQWSAKRIESGLYRGRILAVSKSGVYLHNIVLPNQFVTKYRNKNHFDARVENLVVDKVSTKAYGPARKRGPKVTKNKWGYPGVSFSRAKNRFEVWYYKPNASRTYRSFPFTSDTQEQAFQAAIEFRATLDIQVPGVIHKTSLE